MVTIVDRGIQDLRNVVRWRIMAHSIHSNTDLGEGL
jgi:hypothetical protein